MTQRPKHLAGNTGIIHSALAGKEHVGHEHAGGGPVIAARHPGGIRPGEGRFDPRAWREIQKEDTLAQEPPPVVVRSKPHVRPSVMAQAAPQSVRNLALGDERRQMPSQASFQPVYARVPAAVAVVGAQPRDGGAPWRYLAVWAVLGSVSAAYVAGMSWQRSSNFNMVIAPVTETLVRMAGDIADLKQVTTALDARERSTSDRVANAESRLSRFADGGMQAAAVPGQVAGQRPTNRAVLAEEAPQAEPARPQRVMAGIALAQPGTPPGLLVGPAAAQVPVKVDPRAPAVPKTTLVNPVKTGGLPEAAPATVGRRQAGLLVASGPSLDAMRLSWSVLSQNHGGVLGPVEPRVQQAGDGSIFQLIAGPYASDADAAKACANLRARGVTCRMAEFGGAAL
jgi:SPOR domain